MLTASKRLDIVDVGSVIPFGSREAELLARQVEKHNAIARSSWQESFYVRRARELGGKTVVELFRSGTIDDVVAEARAVGPLIEQIVVLSSIFFLNKRDLHRRLGVGIRSKRDTDFFVGPYYRYLRAQARDKRPVAGLNVNERFCRSFHRNGFGQLAKMLFLKTSISERLLAALEWIFESRIETSSESSVVKTAIALERLLIFSESESLGKSLAERTAFILSDNGDARAKLSESIKRFYDARSGIVHGSRKKRRLLSPRLQESTDRIVLLLCLKLAANSTLWNSVEALRIWSESQKWGSATARPAEGFSKRAFASTLKMLE